MPDINFYYLEKATLSNLKRIFKADHLVRLSKFLDIESVDYEPKLEREEKIGYYNREKGSAVLEEFWKSSEFIKFLGSITGLNPKFRSANHLNYSPGDYSLLHIDESEPNRLSVVYDFTRSWRLEWGGYDIYTYTSPDKEPLICNRDFASLMIVKLEKGDLFCTRYVSLKSKESTRIDVITYDLD
jgi:hypothetical protein|tara:strand:- start:575 stop:1129 length:555 start_codon:yes stop_codon:yes gene_type:complete